MNPLDVFYSIILEERQNQSKLSAIVSRLITKIKKDIDLVSITPSNRLNNTLVARFVDADDISSKMNKIEAVLKKNKGITVDRAKGGRDGESTIVTLNDKTGRVKIVYKGNTVTRKGVIFEEILAYVLTNKVTNKLKDRLNLPIDAQLKDVVKKITRDHDDLYEAAVQAKKLINSKISNIKFAQTIGSKNSKADIVITDAHDNKYGLSLKVSQDREVRFEFNRNLGYGDEKGGVVSSPSGKPWWIIGRKIFLKNLKRAGKFAGKEYNPDPEDYTCPAWLIKAKRDNPEIFKMSIEDLYEQIRNIYVQNLKKMPMQELVDMVKQSHSGKKEERINYRKFFRLTYDTEGVNIEEIANERADLNIVKYKNMTSEDVVEQDGSKIIIRIPGMEELVINSVKFHSSLFGDTKESLKIKTR